MSDASKTVNCSRHGETPATFVCSHLCQGVACGYHDGGTEGDPWPDAWCDACQALLGDDGEWTDENMAEINLALLCTGCYEEARARNEDIPTPFAAGQIATDAVGYARLVEVAFEHMKEVQEVSRSRWGFGGKTSFHYDALTRSLWFYDAGAAAGVVAQAEVVGSFSTKTSTWLWSWANEGSTSDDRARFGPLRVLGEVRGIAKFAGAQWEAEEVDGWEVTQIAGYVLGAEGIYRAPMRHLMVFFLLQRLREEPLPRELLT